MPDYIGAIRDGYVTLSPLNESITTLNRDGEDWVTASARHCNFSSKQTEAEAHCSISQLTDAAMCFHRLIQLNIISAWR
ncbi:hypothetical protein [Escherichia coli]